MPERLNKLVNEIRAFTAPERPFFMHVFCLNWFLTPTQLAELKAMLGDEYVVVRPDHLCMLYRKALGGNKKLALTKKTKKTKMPLLKLREGDFCCNENFQKL
jgi:hypothetical protein